MESAIWNGYDDGDDGTSRPPRMRTRRMPPQLAEPLLDIRRPEPTRETVPCPDDTLLARFVNGDRAALDLLFHRYRSVAYRVAFRLLGREADALDAVQEGFIKALTHLEGFRRSSSFKTWLLRIVSNAALDLGRQRQRELARDRGVQARFSLLPADGPSPAANLDRADLRNSIDRALAQLPESQRRTFVLHVDGGLSYREVADTLGISIGTVMSRLYYARQKLQGLLADIVHP